MQQEHTLTLQEIFISNLKFYWKKRGLSQEALYEKLSADMRSVLERI